MVTLCFGPRGSFLAYKREHPSEECVHVNGPDKVRGHDDARVVHLFGITAVERDWADYAAELYAVKRYVG
jgi:hypothetical protein